MPNTRSNSAENLFMLAVILAGCSASVVIIRSIVCGLWRIKSTAAMINDRLLLMSWRIAESFLFNSPSCSTVNVTGSLGNPIPKNGQNQMSKARVQALQPTFRLNYSNGRKPGLFPGMPRFAPEQLEIEGERRFKGAHGCERGISSFETNGKLGDGRAERMKIG